MHTLKLTAAALACALLATPSLADGPGGNWTCTIAGAPAGNLTMDAASYSFTKAGASEAASGDYSLDANMVHVSSGPLAELGVKLGYFNPNQSPVALVFSIAPGKGLKCSPA